MITVIVYLDVCFHPLSVTARWGQTIADLGLADLEQVIFCVSFNVLVQVGEI